MSLISKNFTFTVGSTIIASEHNANFDTIYSDYNGNITNANISGSAAISDSKLAQITSASKVSGASFTSLSSISSAAGDIPTANMSTNALVLSSGTQTANGVKTFSAIILLPGTNPTQDNEASRKAYVDRFSFASILDYGTSASASTIRLQSALRICYGSLTINGSSNSSLSNLPFTSSSSYVITATFGTATDAIEAIVITRSSGSAATIYNNDNQQQAIMWTAVGI